MTIMPEQDVLHPLPGDGYVALHVARLRLPDSCMLLGSFRRTFCVSFAADLAYLLQSLSVGLCSIGGVGHPGTTSPLSVSPFRYPYLCCCGAFVSLSGLPLYRALCSKNIQRRAQNAAVRSSLRGEKKKKSTDIENQKSTLHTIRIINIQQQTHPTPS